MSFATTPFHPLRGSRIRAQTAASVLGKCLASIAVFACLSGLSIHFHITTYAYLAWSLAGSFAIYAWTRPGAASVAATVAFAALLAAIYANVEGEPVLAATPAFLGLGSLANLSFAALWSGAERRPEYTETGIAAALFPMFLITSGFALGVSTALHPKTLDLFLYGFDARLGMQPSFLAGRLLSRFHPLRQLCYFGYEALPLAMAIAFALERSRRERRSSSIMAAFMVAALGGYLAYNLFPAVGPVHIFGNQFPNSPPSAGIPLALAAIEPAPRNAMPSVHIAMALLIFWNSRTGPKLWRMVAGVLLGATVLATLGFGEHYLVDLLVAVPFALAAQAVGTAGLKWRTMERAACATFGLATVVGWLMYLRLSQSSTGATAWPWMVLLGGAVLSMPMESRLARVAARMNDGG